MANYLTITKLVARLKKEHPETAIGKSFVRTRAVNGQIPSIKAGNRYLIDYETFDFYLANPVVEVSAKEPEYGTLRKVQMSKTGR